VTKLINVIRALSVWIGLSADF